jgi:hypothetical protein
MTMHYCFVAELGRQRQEDVAAAVAASRRYRSRRRAWWRWDRTHATAGHGAVRSSLRAA